MNRINDDEYENENIIMDNNSSSSNSNSNNDYSISINDNNNNDILNISNNNHNHRQRSINVDNNNNKNNSINVNNNNSSSSSSSSNSNSNNNKKIEYWKTRINLGLCPILFLEGLFFFCYIPFTYYYVKNIYNGNNILADSLILFFFHIIFIITQICFYRASFTDPGGIPDNFPDFLLSQDNESISFYESNSLGQCRKCAKCSLKKPDRSHHCKVCKRCTLKMDHHCPFINNCVGYFNYKFFVLFLMWTTILCLYVLLSTSSNLKNLLEDGSESLVLGIVSIIALVFGLGLAVFTGTHMAYIFKNETTIEHFEKNSRPRNSNLINGGSDHNSSFRPINIYNLGFKKNFCQVFGKNPLKWFLPIANDYTILSGLEFTVQNENSPLISVSSV